MEMLAQSGRGVVKILHAAENGEPLAYWSAGFMLLYIAAATGFLAYCWVTGRLIERKRDRIGYSIGFGISICYAGFVVYGIISRLMS
jgi:hypothetical protein